MDQVTVQQRQEIAKTSTEGLRGRLMAAGYEETVIALDRNELMEAYAQHVLKPRPQSLNYRDRVRRANV